MIKFMIHQGNELGIAGARIEHNLKKYAPSDIQFVSIYDEADVVLIHHQYQHDLDYFQEHLKKPFIYMISEIYTDKNYLNNFFANDYLKLIWTFNPLDYLGYDTKGKFVYAPMGYDADLFDIHYNIIQKQPRNNKVICFNSYDSENHESIYNATKMTDSKMIHCSFSYQDFLRKGKVFDNKHHWYPGRYVSDEELKQHYLSCQFVSGLRSACGFEVVILEGIACGCRPIIFDNVYYTNWFKDFSVIVPEEINVDLTLSLVDVFKNKYKPVTKEEIDYVKSKFSWEVVAKHFWYEVLQRL